MDDFRKLIADREAVYHPDIAAIHVHALTCALHDIIQEWAARGFLGAPALQHDGFNAGNRD